VAIDLMNDIFLLSVTHRFTPIAMRERLALDQAGQASLLSDVSDIADEAVAIVTCNRTEIYGVSQNDDAAGGTERLLAAHTGLSPVELSSSIRCMRGVDVAHHLFRVAAGLDSLVVGEPQILGQVRQAADFARETGSSGPILERLFNYALVAGKRARHETPISRGAGSISHAAVELANSTLGGLRDRQGLVIGLGEMGQLVARNLSSHGLNSLTLCNRSPERSAGIARQLHAADVGWDRLDDALTTADICITATGAREPFLTRARLEQIVPKRNQRPLLMIDIAVPRNVEPEARALPGIHLYDIDSLQTIREENLQSREETIPLVEAIIDQELRHFHDWHRGRASAPIIQGLRQHAEAIREQEVQRALRKLGHLDERDREIVMALSRAITNKLLHEPVTRLKRSPDPREHAQAVVDLFGLEDVAPVSDLTNAHNED
jgi:glutamyl-tRNA reductase